MRIAKLREKEFKIVMLNFHYSLLEASKKYLIISVQLKFHKNKNIEQVSWTPLFNVCSAQRYSFHIFFSTTTLIIFNIRNIKLIDWKKGSIFMLSIDYKLCKPREGLLLIISSATKLVWLLTNIINLVTSNMLYLIKISNHCSKKTISSINIFIFCTKTDSVCKSTPTGYFQ